MEGSVGGAERTSGHELAFALTQRPGCTGAGSLNGFRPTKALAAAGLLRMHYHTCLHAVVVVVVVVVGSWRSAIWALAVVLHSVTCGAHPWCKPPVRCRWSSCQSCLAWSCPRWSYPPLSCQLLSCPPWSCQQWSSRRWSCPLWSCRPLSCRGRSCRRRWRKLPTRCSPPSRSPRVGATGFVTGTQKGAALCGVRPGASRRRILGQACAALQQPAQRQSHTLRPTWCTVPEVMAFGVGRLFACRAGPAKDPVGGQHHVEHHNKQARQSAAAGGRRATGFLEDNALCVQRW